MRALGMVGLGLVLVLAAGVGLDLVQRAEAQNSGVGKEVIMIRCDAANKDFTIRAYVGSTASPVKRSDSCPETLSLLKKEGFVIETVGYFDTDSDFVVYTLMR